jgi:putative transposase
LAEDLNIAGGMPPAFRNHLVPTGCDTPASSAASSLLRPLAIARQNLFCSSRPAADGRPGDGNGARPDRVDRRFRMLIATSNLGVLRRPLESAQYSSEQFQRLMADGGILRFTPEERQGVPVQNRYFYPSRLLSSAAN